MDNDAIQISSRWGPDQAEGKCDYFFQPVGVEKDIFSVDCGEKGFCQKPLVDMSFVKMEL